MRTHQLFTAPKCQCLLLSGLFLCFFTLAAVCFSFIYADYILSLLCSVIFISLITIAILIHWISAGKTQTPSTATEVSFAESARIIEMEMKWKTMEAELLRQKSELDNIFDMVPAHIVYKDTSNRILRVNNQFCSDLLFKKEEVEGRYAEEIFPMFAAGYYESDKEILESGQPKRGIMEMTMSASGEIRYINVDKIPVRDLNGNITGIAAFVKDITNEQIAKNSEMDKQIRLEKYFNNSPNYIYVFKLCDDKNSFTFCDINSAALKLYGLPKSSIIGNRPEAVFPRVCDEELNEILFSALNDNEKQDRKYDYFNDAGKHIWIEVIVYRLTFQEVVMVVRDITRETEAEIFLREKEEQQRIIAENARLQEELNRQREVGIILKRSLEKEKEINEIKTNFLSFASHEFKTPLTAIRSSADLLSILGQKIDEEKYRTYISYITEAVENMTGMLDQILLLSRTEKGKIFFNPVKSDLRLIVKEIIDSVGLQPYFSHVIKTNFDVTDYQQSVDPAILKSLIINIVSNAAKYSPAGSEIIVSVSQTGNSLEFIIEDNGIGIPEKEIKNVFEPFFRAANAGDTPGTGLGLAIAAEMAKLHQGTVHIESRMGTGTRVYIQITSQNESLKC